LSNFANLKLGLSHLLAGSDQGGGHGEREGNGYVGFIIALNPFVTMRHIGRWINEFTRTPNVQVRQHNHVQQIETQIFTKFSVAYFCRTYSCPLIGQLIDF
jgi:hypothetical protein